MANEVRCLHCDELITDGMEFCSEECCYQHLEDYNFEKLLSQMDELNETNNLKEL